MREPQRGSETVEGLRLAFEEWGAGAWVVLLHGFTGSARAMDGVARALSRHRRVLALDLPGHGESDTPADPDLYTMERCVAQVRALARARGAQRAHWLGYSLGGRVALSVAAAAPASLRSLVLLGASPGLPTPEERRARIASDEALARRIEQEGVPAFVEHWESIPLFASQRGRLSPAAWCRQRRARLASSARGLAGSLRGIGSGAMPPLHDRLVEIDCPALLLAGDEDARFLALAEQMARALPDARVQAVPEAGHAAHLENEGAFVAAVEAFLERVEAREPGSSP